ncbi:predicted protein [Arabidopsis lyrata subsp. lyrata]|uniref:Predicted protein n=1 Tax=Arabidopsis lyrata subsp. lyrata TaxID=81972 RepID=D7KPC5_ARALL|nr:predicted protein [Arabidopsis lyrata subsp. lyrata]
MSPMDLKPKNSDPKSQNYQGPLEEQIERYRMFMIEGGCKESFTGNEDCEGNTIECTEKWLKLKKCMEVHIDYYQPYYAVWKKVDELEERNGEPVYPSKEPNERAKQASEFVRGPCKEPLSQQEALDTMYKCMEAYSDYYEAFLADRKNVMNIILRSLTPSWLRRNYRVGILEDPLH